MNVWGLIFSGVGAVLLAIGQDVVAGKATFVSILGVARARAQARLLVEQAVAHLDMFDTNTELLRQAARFVVERNVDVDRLFTHRWKLEQAEEAYRLFDTQTTGKGVFLM